MVTSIAPGGHMTTALGATLARWALQVFGAAVDRHAGRVFAIAALTLFASPIVQTKRLSIGASATPRLSVTPTHLAGNLRAITVDFAGLA